MGYSAACGHDRLFSATRLSGAAACHAKQQHLSARSQDPLHGITLKQILTELQARFGWEGMAREVPIRCFSKDPSLNSSLTFLRRTPWARKQVEDWYVSVFVLK